MYDMPTAYFKVILFCFFFIYIIINVITLIADNNLKWVENKELTEKNSK